MSSSFLVGQLSLFSSVNSFNTHSAEQEAHFEFFFLLLAETRKSRADFSATKLTAPPIIQYDTIS